MNLVRDVFNSKGTWIFLEPGFITKDLVEEDSAVSKAGLKPDFLLFQTAITSTIEWVA